MTNSRRTFIKQTSAVIAGATFLPTITSQARPLRSPKIGIQLFSLEKEMMHDAKGTLRSLKDSGYEYIEHSNYNNRSFYGFSPKDFRTLIKDSGLSLLGGHTVLEPRYWIKKTRTFSTAWHNAIEDASIAGQEYMITPWLDKRFWKNESGLKEFLQVFNRSGELCREAGMTFGYHNHDFEFTHQFRDQTLYDIILQDTDANLVAQQLDIGNMQQENVSVADLLIKYPGRFSMMHVKNIHHSQTRHERYKHADLAEGLLDLEQIMKLARHTGGTSEFILDQGFDITTPPVQSASQNFDLFNKYLSLAA